MRTSRYFEKVKRDKERFLKGVKMSQSMLFNPEDLPASDSPKRKGHDPIFQDTLLKILNDKKLTDAMVVRATGIPANTFNDWVTGKVKKPMADENLYKLVRFLKVDTFYLLYGTKMDEAV